CGVLKVFLLMRLSALIIIVTSFQLSAKTFSQEMLTVKLKNLDLSRAFKEVEKKSNYRFVFSNMILPENVRVNINAKEMPLGQLLGKLLENTTLTFKIMENNLIVINSPLFDQKIITVRGRVTDSKGEPLPNVSIAVNKSDKGAT